MSTAAANHWRRIWAQIVRAYHLACARDDTATHGLIVPSGVWICRRCQQVLLEVTALREHLLLECSTP